MKKAVFLDRDGVLNRSILLEGLPKPPYCIKDIEIIDRVPDAIQLLRNHDYVPVVVTNQPDVARGIVSREQVEEINFYIGSKTGIEHFYTCFHEDKDLCYCRKPLPGLIHLAAGELSICVEESFMVGDRWRDVLAGNSAGCKTFFIDYSYPESPPIQPFTRVFSLYEATQIIIGDQNGSI